MIRLIRALILSIGLLGTSFSSQFVERLAGESQPAAIQSSVAHSSVTHSSAAQRSLFQGSAVEDHATHLVQEPSRKSFRPDFSALSMKRANQRTSLFMLRAFNEAMGDNWKSTVQLIHSGDQIALGAIVDSDGWIVTKASQLPPTGEVTCRLHDGRECVVAVINKVQEHDLALVHISEANLTAITWDTSSTVPLRGKWLATTDLKATPIAVGVISAGIQSVLAEDPRLGVRLAPSPGGGAVSLVLPGSGADEAGVRVGDTVYSVNGTIFNSHDEVLRAIKVSGRAGEYIRLGIDRAERRFEVDARLMDLTAELCDPTEMEVNGRVSARSTGFSKVFLHDTVLEPQQCGGPLVNLDGKVVGINIARAGRVSSYALPAEAIRPIVDSLLAQAKLVSLPAKPADSTLRPIR